LEKKLKLKVNVKKSAVAESTKRKFLGYRLLKDGRLGIAPESKKRLEQKIAWTPAAHMAMDNIWFKELGLIDLKQRYLRLNHS
jgi:hypothetical protein